MLIFQGVFPTQNGGPSRHPGGWKTPRNPKIRPGRRTAELKDEAMTMASGGSHHEVKDFRRVF